MENHDASANDVEMNIDQNDAENAVDKIIADVATETDKNFVDVATNTENNDAEISTKNVVDNSTNKNAADGSTATSEEVCSTPKVTLKRLLSS